MRSVRIREIALLFIGDLTVLFFSLWATLLIRYVELPDVAILKLHIIPFVILFVIWMFIFYVSGLYDQHTMIFRARLPDKLLRVQVGNIVLAAIFFFFIPYFGIAPKTNLVIYLIVSFSLILLWRLSIVPILLRRARGEALLVGGGLEFQELLDEVNANSRYPFYFSETISVDDVDGGGLAERMFAALKNQNLSFAVVDIEHPKLVNILPHLYKPLFSNIEFINAHDLYEEIFERVPLSILRNPAQVERLAEAAPGTLYNAIKRIVDIIGGVAMGIVTLIALPFVWIAMRIEGPGPLFLKQERIGKNGALMYAYKFRSMQFDDSASSTWVREEAKKQNCVTRVGAFLRRTSLDEFPQFLNVLSGELSLIGPRNDILGLGKRLADEIPSYNMRYVIKPGITGWAQINQQYEQGNISPQSIRETKVRLAYDFYYIKHRSFMLDVAIALKTLKRMIFRLSS